MTEGHLPRAGLLLVLVAGLSGCGAASGTPVATTPGNASPSVSVPLPPTRPQLPEAFPVLPGATELALPADDPGLIAQWTTDLVGAAAYDFYSAALPAAGYRLEGRYPGDTGAMIRFIGPAAALWQVVIQAADGDTARIEVRLDRP